MLKLFIRINCGAGTKKHTVNISFRLMCDLTLLILKKKTSLLMQE